MVSELWTVVEHSRYVFHEDPAFQWSVEPMQVTSAELAEQIRGAGGVLLPSRVAAEQMSWAENFPADGRCMLACVRGDFTSPRLNGQRLYIPPRPRRPGILQPAA
jgi:hypothetical protein